MKVHATVGTFVKSETSWSLASYNGFIILLHWKSSNVLCFVMMTQTTFLKLVFKGSARIVHDDKCLCNASEKWQLNL